MDIDIYHARAHARGLAAEAIKAQTLVCAAQIVAMTQHNAIQMAISNDGSRCYTEEGFVAVQSELEELAAALSALSHEAHRDLDALQSAKPVSLAEGFAELERQGHDPS